MKLRTLATVAVVAALALTGCSTGPTQEQVAERFLIEFGGAMNLPEEHLGGFQELALKIAADLDKGMCGNDAYFAGLGTEESLVYAVGSTCLMMYEDEMSQERIDIVKAQLIERVLENTEE